MYRCSSVEDAFSNWWNVFMVLKLRVISPETAIPEIPVAKIAETSVVVIPPTPIIGVSVCNSSKIAV